MSLCSFFLQGVPSGGSYPNKSRRGTLYPHQASHSTHSLRHSSSIVLLSNVESNAFCRGAASSGGRRARDYLSSLSRADITAGGNSTAAGGELRTAAAVLVVEASCGYFYCATTIESIRTSCKQKSDWVFVLKRRCEVGSVELLCRRR